MRAGALSDWQGAHLQQVMPRDGDILKYVLPRKEAALQAPEEAWYLIAYAAR